MIAILYALQVLLTGAGDWFAKSWSQNGRLYYMMMSLAIYIISCFVWYGILKHGAALSQGAVIVSVGYVVLAVLIGKLVFHETITPTQWAGIALGIMAILLLEI